MPREYRRVKRYEKEIFELREQGLSQRQIAEKLGFPYKKCTTFSNGIIEISEKSNPEQG